MTSFARARAFVGATLVAAALALTACGSSGGGGGSVSTTDVETALKKNSEISAIKSEVNSSQYNAVVQCLAQVLQKHASSGDLKAFVNGTKTLDDVQGSNATAAGNEAQSCVKTALGTA